MDVIIKHDFKKESVQSVEVGLIAGAKGIDVTKELIEKDYEIKNTSFAKEEAGFMVLTGHSSIMKVPMRIIMWNQTNLFMIQVAQDTNIEKYGERAYDKYADSIELLAYIDYEKQKAKMSFHR